MSSLQGCAALISTSVQDLSSLGDPGTSAGVWMPDARGVMAKASDLVYNDAPWVPDQRVRFVHARLSHQVRCLLLSVFMGWPQIVPWTVHSVLPEAGRLLLACTCWTLGCNAVSSR